MKPPDERCYEQPLGDDTHVATLSPFTSQAIDDVDNHLTAHELERRMQLITEASRVIDLTEILYVQRSFGGDDDENSRNYYGNSNHNNSNSTVNNLSSPDPELLDIMSRRNSSLPETMLRVQQQQLQQQQQQHQHQHQNTPVLELIMQNGLVIRLRVIVRKKKEELLLK